VSKTSGLGIVEPWFLSKISHQLDSLISRMKEVVGQ